MPVYVYICKNCSNEEKIFASVKCKILPCKVCKEYMSRKMPVLSGHVQVSEIIDKYTNKKWKQDQEEILSDRKAEYFWRVEVPRMVNSGTYSIETMLENGWIYFDDKEQVHVRTKPPTSG